MKVSFVGNFGARPEVANTILAKVTEKIEPTILFDIGDTQRLIPALADAEIVVSHIWKSDFPEAPNLKLLQSPAAGLDLIDLPSLPGGVSVCNVDGHEQAIAEYVLMTMLALSHRLLDIATAFRDHGNWSGGGAGGGPLHGEILGKTVGIIGYGKIGRETAKRAAAFGCRGHRGQSQPGRRQRRCGSGLSAWGTRPRAARVRRGGDRCRSRPGDARDYQ